MSPRLPLAILLLALPAAAQSAAGQKGVTEQQDLERALSAAGASPVEYLRAIESHMARYPDTARRAELESAAARAAIDAGDNRAIVQYGERVLVRHPDDLSILDAVARALVAGESHDGWERALRYARRSEDLLLQQRNDASRRGVPAPDLQDQIDRALARALLTEAAASGKLGNPADALALAGRAFETFPGAEAAREQARWHERLNLPLDAARDLADAITVSDPAVSADERARDRARMDELFRKAKGSAAGEGDLLLEALDRNLALVQARQLRMRAGDPNALIADPMDFTIGGLDGSKLAMTTLKGKVVVLDFWATWCVPCREQHPLLEQVRNRFAGNPAVVFLSIDTDIDREPVQSFVAQQHWDDRVYFDDGLSRKLAVMSLPTTVVFDRSGKVFSRLTGFVAAQFVSTLTDRISAASTATLTQPRLP
jgi:thiol-disulfide isomerase/thioredoxin